MEAAMQVEFWNAVLDAEWVLLPQECLNALAYN